MQQLGWIKPLTHQRAVEIVTAAHVPQAGGKLVGLVAQLANRQRLAQGIPGRRGQGGDGAAQAAAQRAGQPGQAIPDARTPEIAVVSPKELIAAIAAEGHREAGLPSGAAHQMGGQLGGIGKRFAVELGQLGDQSAGIGAGEQGFAVAGAQVLGHRPGIGGFVEAGFFKADGEGAQRLAALALQQGCDQGGIDPSGEKGPQRHIGDRLLGHGQAETLLQGIQGLGIALKGSGAARLNHGTELPPGLAAGQRGPRGKGQGDRHPVTSRQLGDVGIDGQGCGHLAKTQQLGQGRAIDGVVEPWIGP